MCDKKEIIYVQNVYLDDFQNYAYLIKCIVSVYT